MFSIAFSTTSPIPDSDGRAMRAPTGSFHNKFLFTPGVITVFIPFGRVIVNVLPNALVFGFVTYDMVIE